MPKDVPGWFLRRSRYVLAELSFRRSADLGPRAGALRHSSSASAPTAGQGHPSQAGRDEPLSSVRLGPFRVADARRHDLVTHLVRGAVSGVRYVAYDLHVGGFNSQADADFVRAINEADLVYADGASVVLLARLAGARQVERAPTTDLGWSLLRELGTELGRRPRVALVGGPDGLSARAGAVLSAEAGVDVVVSESGYQADWEPALARLSDSACDVLFVGLGIPREMKWVDENRAALPSCLIMTCGGWFGFVTSDEKRAPTWMQNHGLEWCYRVAQAPRRLGGRYARGAVACMSVAVSAVVGRVVSWRPSRG